MKRFHLIMTFVWSVVLALAIIGFAVPKVRPLAWLLGVAFVSLCSIYANLVGHWSTYTALRAEEAAKQ